MKIWYFFELSTRCRFYSCLLPIAIFFLLVITMERSSAYTSTIVIGLNPALQRRFVLSSKTPFLTPGNVHRASEIQEGIGGKGQDVYVALHCLSSFTSVAQAQGQGQGHSDDSIMNGTSTSTIHY